MSKRKGWKSGVLTKDLRAVVGKPLKKGQEVYYKRYKRLADKDGFRLTEYEWHYTDTENSNLIRTTEIIIEGVPYFKEPYLH